MQGKEVIRQEERRQQPSDKTQRKKDQVSILVKDCKLELHSRVGPGKEEQWQEARESEGIKIERELLV